jgi:hypothetical protein
VTETHPLIGHLASSKVAYTNYDFRWLRQYKVDWDKQKTIDEAHQAAMTACLIHFNLDTSLLMRYLGNNYTGAYREVDKTVHISRQHKIVKTS